MKTHLILTTLTLLTVGCGKPGSPPSSPDSQKVEDTKPTDTDLKRGLIGKWVSGLTNAKGNFVQGEYIFNQDGSMIWRGSFRTGGLPENFVATGPWRVEQGYLVTKVTNSSNRRVAYMFKSESRDEIISVTTTQFSLQIDKGQTKIYTRNQNSP